MRITDSILLARTSFVALAFFAALSSQAEENFGWGSRSTALGQSSVMLGGDAYEASKNPALLPVSENPEKNPFRFSAGLVFSEPKFSAIGPVVIENSTVGSQLQTGSVEHDYPSIFGTQIGIRGPLSRNFHGLSFGLNLFLPLTELATLDTGENFLPEYVLYRARSTRPIFDMGFGMKLNEQHSIGVGVHWNYVAKGFVNAFVQTSANRPSSLRLSTTLKPSIAPYLGYFYNGGKFRYGSAFRFASGPESQFDVNFGAQALGNLAALDFHFAALSTLYYDPLSWENGFQWDVSEVWSVFFQIDYQRWSAFRYPTVQIVNPVTDNCSGSSCGVSISPSQNQNLALKDLWIPRIGAERAVSEFWKLRAGYSYRPSIYKDLPSGVGNFLDPARHQFGFGAGYTLPEALLIGSKAVLDFHVNYQALVEETVTKSAGDIGAPGYTSGGKVYGAGVSLNIEL